MKTFALVLTAIIFSGCDQVFQKESIDVLAPVGRFQIHQHPVGNTFLLDTATGDVWKHAFIEDGEPIGWVLMHKEVSIPLSDSVLSKIANDPSIDVSTRTTAIRILEQRLGIEQESLTEAEQRLLEEFLPK